MTLPNDIVFHAISREYNSRRANVARDEIRAKELHAQLLGLSQSISVDKIAMMHLEEFAVDQGWDTKDLAR